MNLVNGNWMQTIAVEIEKIHNTIAELGNNLPGPCEPCGTTNYITVHNHHTHHVHQTNIQVNTSLVIPENVCCTGVNRNEYRHEKTGHINYEPVKCIGSGNISLVKRGKFVINEWGQLQNV